MGGRLSVAGCQNRGPTRTDWARLPRTVPNEGGAIQHLPLPKMTLTLAGTTLNPGEILSYPRRVVAPRI